MAKYYRYEDSGQAGKEGKYGNRPTYILGMDWINSNHSRNR